MCTAINFARLDFAFDAMKQNVIALAVWNVTNAVHHVERTFKESVMSPWGLPIFSKSPDWICILGKSFFLDRSGRKFFSENDLHTLFSSLVAVKEIRMVMDKFTNAPRGFAFVHFFSVADASRAMNTFQVILIQNRKEEGRRDAQRKPKGRQSNCFMRRTVFHP